MQERNVASHLEWRLGDFGLVQVVVVLSYLVCKNLLEFNPPSPNIEIVSSRPGTFVCYCFVILIAFQLSRLYIPVALLRSHT